MGILPNGIDLSTSVENEWLCHILAKHFGLPVANTQMAQFENIRCLIVERFDREWSSDRTQLKRIPQEDLCQSLGVSGTRKYQSDGGPNIRDIMSFLDASDYRDQDRSLFMRAQIFFFLIGAIDGHAKNFSIYITPSGFRLTPLYDIMTIFPALASGQVQRSDVKLAMSVGQNNHYQLDEIYYRHWEQTAKTCAYPIAQLQNDIKQLLNRVTTIESIYKLLPNDFPKQIAEQTIQGIYKQAKYLE